MDKILKQMQQMNAEMKRDLTEKMNAKFEQLTANAKMNNAELTLSLIHI